MISSVDLSNVTRISIHWNMLCSQNMFFTFSSFVNSTQVNDTLPSLSAGRLYRTYSTLLVSLGLTHLLNSFSWSLRPLIVTLRHRTFNLWGSPPLNSAWTSIHPTIIASNLHNKKLKIINEKLIQTFHQTLGSKNDNYNINMQTSKQLSNISHLHVTLYHILQKKGKFKQTLNLKKSKLTIKNLT